jgi:hypothetical protein
MAMTLRLTAEETEALRDGSTSSGPAGRRAQRSASTPVAPDVATSICRIAAEDADLLLRLGRM